MTIYLSSDHPYGCDTNRRAKRFIALLNTLFVISMLLCATTAKAQLSIGVSGGYTSNKLTTSSSFFYDKYYQEKGGFSIAVPVRYSFTDWFGLQAELSYIQKNYQWKRAHPFEVIRTEYRNGFLNLPVMADFSFGGQRLRGFVNLGAYIGYWASAKHKGYALYDFAPKTEDESNDIPLYSYDERREFDSRRDNRFDAGLLAGVGLRFKASDLIEVFTEGRYMYGLTDLQKKYMTRIIPRYNNTLSVQVGVMFHIF